MTVAVSGHGARVLEDPFSSHFSSLTPAVESEFAPFDDAKWGPIYSALRPTPCLCLNVTFFI